MLSQSGHAVVIGFDSGIDFKVDYPGHIEKGFLITPVDGPWRPSPGGGHPGNCIFAAPLFGGVQPAIQVQRVGGGPFQIKTIDVFPENLGTNCAFQGWRNGELVINETWFSGQATFRTVVCRSQEWIDTLTFTIKPTTYPESIALDTIVVEPVPEPASLWALAPLVAATCRKRRA